MTKLDLQHEELVHDIAFDYFGKRLASCSSDRHIKVFDYKDDKWTLHDSFKAHDASIINVDWAHPEFGQVLASSSHDKSVKIWEQSELQVNPSRRWIERAKLQDSNQITTHISFAPRCHGLLLSACSYDGRVRIYEAIDPLNLSAWILVDDICVSALLKDMSSHHYCLSWCQSQTLPRSFVVGLGREHTCKIYTHDGKWREGEQLRGHTDIVVDVKWSPSIGKSYQLIATACRDDKIRLYKVRGKVVEMVFEGAHSCVNGLDWNVTGTVLSSSSDDGRVLMWKSAFYDDWKCVNEIKAGE